MKKTAFNRIAVGGAGRARPPRHHARQELTTALDAAFAERGRFQLIEFMAPPATARPRCSAFRQEFTCFGRGRAVAG
ncbi:hypothetical protein C6571_06695 [Simplicispira suum]|uniref:Uncharacterized protein n=1 Tax=Simplicispira suum TaxID=2109915 RepID=A0A2S0MYP4_9BURK|nr:hypothetical protein C6571_06695 [Simplicispira suum]